MTGLFFLRPTQNHTRKFVSPYMIGMSHLQKACYGNAFTIEK